MFINVSHKKNHKTNIIMYNIFTPVFIYYIYLLCSYQKSNKTSLNKDLFYINFPGIHIIGLNFENDHLH